MVVDLLDLAEVFTYPVQHIMMMGFGLNLFHHMSNTPFFVDNKG